MLEIRDVETGREWASRVCRHSPGSSQDLARSQGQSKRLNVGSHLHLCASLCLFVYHSLALSSKFTVKELAGQNSQQSCSLTSLIPERLSQPIQWDKRTNSNKLSPALPKYATMPFTQETSKCNFKKILK